MEALEAYERESDRDNLNFELEIKIIGNRKFLVHILLMKTFYTNISDELFNINPKIDQENLDIENVLRVDSIKNIKEFTYQRFLILRLKSMRK